ncbi:hypothetical protein B0H13DRAFT_2399174 [Mycena leptocephala]|nr:hypothetical protein B0H13DRAFT_2399174 [Mycena leptocephala]
MQLGGQERVGFPVIRPMSARYPPTLLDHRVHAFRARWRNCIRLQPWDHDAAQLSRRPTARTGIGHRRSPGEKQIRGANAQVGMPPTRPIMDARTGSGALHCLDWAGTAHMGTGTAPHRSRDMTASRGVLGELARAMLQRTGRRQDPLVAQRMPRQRAMVRQTQRLHDSVQNEAGIGPIRVKRGEIGNKIEGRVHGSSSFARRRAGDGGNEMKWEAASEGGMKTRGGRRHRRYWYEREKKTKTLTTQRPGLKHASSGCQTMFKGDRESMEEARAGRSRTRMLRTLRCSVDARKRRIYYTSRIRVTEFPPAHTPPRNRYYSHHFASRARTAFEVLATRDVRERRRGIRTEERNERMSILEQNFSKQEPSDFGREDMKPKTLGLPPPPPPPPAPTIPTHDELMALVPHGRADNPHRGRQPSQQTPPMLANGRPPFQRNVGDWALPVFAVQRLLENVDPTVASVVTAAHQEFLALPIFNGGQRALTVYKSLLNDVARALSVFAGPDDMVITRPQPLVIQTGEWSKKYMAPFCLFIQFLDPLIRAQVLAQGTYTINRDLGFHAVPIDLAFISWVVGLWKPVASTASVITLIKRIRFAFLLFMVNNPAVVRCIGQMTQGILVGTVAERTLTVAKSADAQFIPHPTDPMIVVYLQPPTTDEAAFEDLKALIRPRTLSYQMSSFTPQSAVSPPECVICKLDTHLTYLCPFAHGDQSPTSGGADLQTAQGPYPRNRPDRR